MIEFSQTKKWLSGDGMSFKIDDRELQELIKRLLKSTTKTDSLMKDIAIYMKTQVMENFQSEGRPNKWESLAAKTLKAKIRKKGTAGKILESYGKLKQSINLRSDNIKAQVFSGIEYGVYHQTGTRKMPQRAFMPTVKNEKIPPFDSKGIDDIKKLIMKHLMSEV